MAACNLFSFSSALLLLLLLTLSWRASTSLPVHARTPEAPGQTERCPALFRSLLLRAKELLNSSVLCFGITSDKAAPGSRTDTALACMPAQTQSCTRQRNSSFSESECLRNIGRDLAHYAAAFQSYLSSPLRSPGEEVALLSPTLGIIQDLRRNCSLVQSGEKSSSQDVVQMWSDDTFSNRQEMCKMIRGFFSRIITINRAIGYISSGDHRK